MRQLIVGRPIRLVVMLLPVILAACEGGDSAGGFGGVPPESNPLEGKFVDAAVEGIEYLTFNRDLAMPHLSGMTDGAGTYQYENGEFIVFSIGGIVLGATRANAVMTPADLVPADLLPDTQAREQYLLNLIRLIQTLDVDGDANNGITIPQLARNTNPASEVDFSRSSMEFETDLDLQTYIGQVSNVVSLVDSASAIAHFETSIGALVEDGYQDPRLAW